MHPDTTVFVVVPDSAIRQALVALLSTYCVQVRAFPDAESLLNAGFGDDLTKSCLIIEAELPGISGVRLLKKLPALGITIPVIVVVNYSNAALRLQALKLGAAYVLAKPLISDQLIVHLAELLDQPCLLETNTDH